MQQHGDRPQCSEGGFRYHCQLHMIWERPKAAIILLYFLFLSLVILIAVLSSFDMRRRNKIIFASIAVAFLFFVAPIFRRLIIKDYLVNEGYSLIVYESFLGQMYGYGYEEADPEEYLWKPFLYGFQVNHENKLLYMYFTRGQLHMLPETLDDIRFNEDLKPEQ